MKKLVVLFILILMLGACLLCTSLCFADEIQEDSQEELVVEETIEATPDNDAWEWVKDAWARCKHILIGAFSGVSASTLVGAVFVVLVKRSTNKVADKIEKNTNTNSIATMASEKILKNLADVKISMEIKPMIVSQVRAVCEEVSQYFVQEQIKQDKKNLAVINILEKIANFYKASVAISDEQRDALNEAIAEAKKLYENYDNTTTAVVEVSNDTEEQKITTIIPENY